jgi:hypothetical protein
MILDLERMLRGAAPRDRTVGGAPWLTASDNGSSIDEAEVIYGGPYPDCSTTGNS